MLPTGRIRRGPAPLLDDAVLTQRFDWETRTLLRHYRWIELTHTGEYARMGLLDRDAAERIRRAVLDLTPEQVGAERAAAMSDPLFALERCVQAHVPESAHAWHVDRSRNDVQACAQLMHGRERLLETVTAVSRLARAALETAAGHTTSIMPGYTQHQTAQTMTFGFYLAALAEAVTGAAESLQALFDAVNLCPLGAGAMAGLELPWDRGRIAVALGFDGPQPHALTSVASRAWVLRTAGELSVLGTTLSRFLTDLIWWSGSSCRFIDLPDELAGISSAMPHKRNFPILERIRGMSGHLVGLSYDLMIGQRNTGYTNLVEVSKESTRFLEDLFATCHTMLALFERVVTDVRFHPEPARRVVRDELMAASTVANHLTLEHRVPARDAQVLVGTWISAALERLGPSDTLTPALLSAPDLVAAGERLGFPLTLAEDEVRELLDPEAGVWRKQTTGSTHPEQVRLLLEQVGDRLAAVDRGAAERSRWLREAWEHTTGTKAGEPT